MFLFLSFFDTDVGFEKRQTTREFRVHTQWPLALERAPGSSKSLTSSL